MKRDFSKDRPPPLKISRPSDPHHHHHHQQQQQQQQQQQHQQQQLQQHQQQQHPQQLHRAPPHPGNPNHRPPVIIHTYSPEVIQIDSDNFRQLVQRLTGPGSSHAPPPPKRSRTAAPPSSSNFNPNYRVSSQASAGDASQQPQFALHSALSPRGLRLQQEAPHPYVESSTSYANLPSNPLLSPSLFDFSPSVLPSPSTFSFDFPSMVSPMGGRGSAGLLPSPLPPGGSSAQALPSPLGHGGVPTPRSLAAALPSPGPWSSTFLADLPVLSPAAYSWIEKNAVTADAILASRPLISAGLPPRPPPTTTANLFPHQEPSDDEKPSLYREK